MRPVWERYRLFAAAIGLGLLLAILPTSCVRHASQPPRVDPGATQTATALGAPSSEGTVSPVPADQLPPGKDSICPLTDQRGVTRPQGAHCDISAYEFELDAVAPVVNSVTCTDPNPTNLPSVHFTVTFSEPVNGEDTGDFALDITSLAGAAVTGVSGVGQVYSVVVNTGSGSGTIRLDVVDDDSILDMASNPLGGAGEGNGNFTTGEIYAVRFLPTYLPLIRR